MQNAVPQGGIFVRALTIGGEGAQLLQFTFPFPAWDGVRGWAAMDAGEQWALTCDAGRQGRRPYNGLKRRPRR